MSCSSTIIEDISQYCDGSEQLAYGYFFFDGRDSQKGLQRYEDLLRSLIWQFSTRSHEVPPALYELYEQCNSGIQQPTLEALRSTFPLVLAGFQNVYLILDALDECADQIKLLNWIKEMAGWNVGKLHFLATSRQERDIEVRLQALSPISVCLEGDAVHLDIETYLDRMLQDDDEAMAWNRDEYIREHVKTSLLKGAHGM